MRVVAGSLGGRRLVAPPGRDTRPTSDRVRGALFNALESLDAVGGATAVDLFAGSGALGIEALSRGASHCTFVERAQRALRALRANLAELDLLERSRVVQADALVWRAEPDDRFDLALVDPPYAFDRWTELLARVTADLVVAEADQAVAAPGWVPVRQRAYGGTVVTFLRPVGRPAPG